MLSLLLGNLLPELDQVEGSHHIHAHALPGATTNDQAGAQVRQTPCLRTSIAQHEQVWYPLPLLFLLLKI